MRHSVALPLILAVLIAPGGLAGAAEPSQADVDICRQEAQVAVSQRTGPTRGVGPLIQPMRPPTAVPSPPGTSALPSPTGTAPSAPSLSPGSSMQTGDVSGAFQEALSRCLARRTGGSR